MTVIDERYSHREMASVIAARRIERLIARKLRDAGEASLVVSGGTSPVRCFEELSRLELNWSSVTLVPSDERWVEATDADSNERLIRSTLAVDSAADARIFSLYRVGETPEEAAPHVAQALDDLPRPFAVSLLGIGTDGHFASLFPDADTLRPGLDGDAGVVVVHTQASPHPRISLTLPSLADSAEIVVLAFGDKKRRVLDLSLAGDERYPVSRLFALSRPDVRIVWAP